MKELGYGAPATSTPTTSPAASSPTSPTAPSVDGNVYYVPGDLGAEPHSEVRDGESGA